MKRLIPADTVDAAGNVWETTGENIRNGAREFSEKDAKLLVNAMFPVGSIYFGENSFILSVGKWEALKDGISKPYVLMIDKVSGSHQQTNIASVESVSSGIVGVVLRAWKRVS